MCVQTERDREERRNRENKRNDQNDITQQKYHGDLQRMLKTWDRRIQEKEEVKRQERKRMEQGGEEID